MPQYNFDSFDQAVQPQSQDSSPTNPAVDLSAFDKAHDEIANKQYAPEDQSNVTDAQAAGLNWGGPVTGIKQGALLGFGDEVAALSGAAGAKSGGDKRPFWDVYKDILSSTRAEQKQVQNEHPKSVLAGEVAGGFVSPLALTGSALASQPGAGFWSKAGTMAAAGAAGGGTIGLGNSEADLTSGDVGDIAQAAKDTAAGAGTGAVIGAGIQAIGSGITGAIKGAGNIVNKLPVTEDIMSVFNKTRAGQDLLGKAQEFSAQNRDLARSLIDDVTGLQQASGKFMEMHGDDLNKTNAMVDVKKVVDQVREKLNSLKPIRPEEKDEIEAFKKTLGNMIDEQEKTVISYIKKPTNPNLVDAESKAGQKAAQQTAEAETKDAIKASQLQQTITKEANSTDPDASEIARLQKLLAKVQPKNQTQFPPQDIVDPVTGLTVKAVDRGLGRSPIASAVVPPPEPTFTPLQKIETTSTVAGTPTMSPPDANKLLSSLNEGVSGSETNMGKQAYGMAKDDLQNEINNTVASAPPVPGQPTPAESLEGFNAAKQQYYNTSKAKEMLNLPKNYGPFDSGDKVNDINRIQNLIRDYHQGTQKKQVVDEALDQLRQAYPGTADSLQRQIAEGSQNEYLANELSRGSEFARDPRKILASGKAALLQGARFAGKVAETGDSGTKFITDLGTKVYSSSPEGLQNLASAAATAGKSFATTLAKVAQAPMATRKALLFTLMQQPEFRDFAHQQMNNVPFVGDSQEDESK